MIKSDLKREGGKEKGQDFKGVLKFYTLGKSENTLVMIANMYYPTLNLTVLVTPHGLTLPKLGSSVK